MKNLILAALVLLSVVSYGQGAKKQTPKKSPVTTGTVALDSIVVKGDYRNDTSRVMVVQYMEDKTLNWTRGYLVTKSFVPVGGQPLQIGQVVYDDKWAALKGDDLYDIKAYNWK